jgi:hypothetical protein
MLYVPEEIPSWARKEAIQSRQVADQAVGYRRKNRRIFSLYPESVRGAAPWTFLHARNRSRHSSHVLGAFLRMSIIAALFMGIPPRNVGMTFSEEV